MFYFSNKFKGLPIHPILFDTTHGGDKLPNGTFTEALGLVQSGFVDMLANDAKMNIPLYEGFLLTTPFNVERYVALMKRQQPAIFIDWDGITTGIGVDVYAIMFATLTFLLFVCWLNERCQNGAKKNTNWQLLLSIFPINGEMWPHQLGVTRKVLMATCGFGILILSSLYTAKLAEQMMVPYPPPVVTFRDIEIAVSSQRANLMFTSKWNTAMTYAANISTSLANSMNTRPPIYFKHLNPIDVINTQNGILIYEESKLVQLLSEIPPAECQNYVYVVLDGWTRTYISLLMRKQRKDMLEAWNFIVAERMSYVNNYIQTFRLHEDCQKGLFPVYTPDTSYDSLLLWEFTGPFAFLAILLTLSMFSLLGEIVYAKFVKVEEAVHKENFRFIVDVPETISAPDMQLLYTYHRAMLEIIGK